VDANEQMLRFDVVDVFADRPFAGNPLAVVHGAGGLTDHQLQAIAREFNLSETVFPLAPTQAGASYRARIFTPATELPFAGHPSVGVAWVLARDGIIRTGHAIQECGAGLLPVRVDADGARIDGGPARIGARLDGGALAAAVGLTPDDLVAELSPGMAGAGLDFAVLPVRAGAVARAVAPTASALPEPGMLAVVAFDEASRVGQVRVFAPGVNVAEDPATGSAAVALAVFLIDRGALAAAGDSEFVLIQGVEIGRPSRLEVSVTAEGGRAIRTSVRGRVVMVSHGEIVVPSAGR
jgi:trans-2,3-dihydro-3-hydroxyanthranilate isomerase